MFATVSVRRNPYLADYLIYDELIVDNTSPGLMSTRHESSAQQNVNRLDHFLKSVERRAFRLAQLATGNTDHALDIVQEAMLVLSKKYPDKSEQEWGALFHRILQNKIRDWYRSQSVRHRIFDWFGMGVSSDSEQAEDPIQAAEDTRMLNPAQSLDNDELSRAISAAIAKLPLRQQQAFLLRNWEGLSVKQTAQAMDCSEGSVKTHYSRATQFLQQQLEAFQS